jgi:hypothetical protein
MRGPSRITQKGRATVRPGLHGEIVGKRSDIRWKFDPTFRTEFAWLSDAIHLG